MTLGQEDLIKVARVFYLNNKGSENFQRDFEMRLSQHTAKPFWWKWIYTHNANYYMSKVIIRVLLPMINALYLNNNCQFYSCFLNK